MTGMTGMTGVTGVTGLSVGGIKRVFEGVQGVGAPGLWRGGAAGGGRAFPAERGYIIRV